MTDLKTLKDLTHRKENMQLDGKVFIITEFELKQEAIKWVKAYTQGRSMGKSEWHIQQWSKFMQFFNLTSEDLK